MSRNGAGVYSLPGSYLAVSGETILATQHNTPLEDLEADANNARPIVAGGSGSTTAIGALDNFNKKSSNIASASTVDLSAATGDFVHITGTTTITAFSSQTAGNKRTVVFDGALTLTHNATSLILPGAANIITAAGDSALFVSEGSSNWKCVSYQRAAAPLTQGTYTPTITAGANVASTTAYTCYYTRTGNQVHVWGLVDIDPTAASTATTFSVSLPIASNFTAIGQLSGIATHRNSVAGGMYADAANDRAICDYTTTANVNNGTFSFAFDYVVL